MAAGMRKTDFIAGLLLLGFALVVAGESLRLPFGTMRRPGIAFLPVLLSACSRFSRSVSLSRHGKGAPLQMDPVFNWGFGKRW